MGRTYDLDPLLRPSVDACVPTADRYFPGLTAILCGDENAVDAIEMIEAPSS